MHMYIYIELCICIFIEPCEWLYMCVCVLTVYFENIRHMFKGTAFIHICKKFLQTQKTAQANYFRHCTCFLKALAEAFKSLWYS